MAGRRKRERRDWYSVSVDSLRAWMGFLGVLAILLLAFVGYRYWEENLLKRDASLYLSRARELAEQLEGKEGLSAYRDDYDSALDSYRTALERYRAEDYPAALNGASYSRSLLEWIADTLQRQGAVGEAQFFSVQGGVQFRHGEVGDWQPARDRVALMQGDYVRTSGSGSAQIMFANGTLYTVRPNTQFIVSRAESPKGSGTEQAIEMEYGWVNLNTNQRDSNVTTPDSDAWVRRDSEATVSYDRGSGTARFVAYQGSMSVSSAEGERRELGALQQVVKVNDKLSEPRALPGRPELFDPPDNFQVNFGKVPQLSLAWQRVGGASRYALQVSRNQLFVDNIIDVEDRSRPGATLGVKGEGTFHWRTAAINREGVQGPWSVPRKFRIASLRTGADGDREPPRLELHDIKPYGNLFIIGGTTEPGAEVEINGEPVTVEPDGSFTKTVQLFQEGWSFVTIRARDAWGNEIERRKRVFVEAF